MELKEILNTIRTKGYKITPQRELILQAMLNLKSHFTVEQIFQQVQSKSISLNLATVYRNVEFFESNGIITRIKMGKETCFSLRNHGLHFHLICKNCNVSIEADLEFVSQLKEDLLERYGFSADFEHLAVFGQCAHPACA